MNKQPLAHTSQTGLQELNSLGYSSAVTADKHLQLDLFFVKLNKVNCSLTSSELSSASGILLPLYSFVAVCVLNERQGPVTLGTPDPVTELPEARNGRFETLQKEKMEDLYEDINPLPIPERGLPWWLSGKESTCKAAVMGLIAGLGRPPGGEHGNPLQYCCLENPVDGGAWWATVHGVAKSQTRLSD